MASTASGDSQLWRLRALYAVFAIALIAGAWLSGREITMSALWRGSSAPNSPPTAPPKNKLDAETEVLAMPTPSTLDELHEALARDRCVSISTPIGRSIPCLAGSC
ncbi:MAG TPA: hypothetical protein VG125_09840 [Pirellulales bacterium]|nr:hypothetical protein [Pirellulales bacterium]